MERNEYNPGNRLILLLRYKNYCVTILLIIITRLGQGLTVLFSRKFYQQGKGERYRYFSSLLLIPVVHNYFILNTVPLTCLNSNKHCKDTHCHSVQGCVDARLTHDDDDGLSNGKAKDASQYTLLAHTCSHRTQPELPQQESRGLNSTWYIRHVEASPSKLCKMPPPTEGWSLPFHWRLYSSY